MCITAIVTRKAVACFVIHYSIIRLAISFFELAEYQLLNYTKYSIFIDATNAKDTTPKLFRSDALKC